MCGCVDVWMHGWECANVRMCECECVHVYVKGQGTARATARETPKIELAPNLDLESAKKTSHIHPNEIIQSSTTINVNENVDDWQNHKLYAQHKTMTKQ